MSALQTRSKDTIVGTIAAGIQGRVSTFLNFAIGSVFLAIAEAVAGVALWLQAQNLTIAKLTRLATSYGPDADSFVADYGIVTRLGAQASSGLVTFSRYTAGPSAPVIPIGAQVKTGDGSQVFVVTADLTLPSYSAVLGGYVMPAAIGTLTCPVAAVVAGSAGNVAAGAISLLSSTVPGVDTVTNPAAFTNGFDAESDGSLKSRFRAAIAGLARGDRYGTAAAIEASAIAVQWTLTEGVNPDGTFHPAYYFIVADDGSGVPSQEFIARVAAVADTVRPLGTQVAVFAPTLVSATVAMTISTAAGYDHQTVVAQVAAIVEAGINGLGLGNGLPYTQVAAWAYSVPGVTNVSSVLVNGGTVDLAPDPKKTIKVVNMVVR